MARHVHRASWRAIAAAALLALLAACSAPQAAADRGASARPVPVAGDTTPAPIPIDGGGAAARPGVPAGVPSALLADRSCKVDADCEIGTVQTCCGAAQGCVRKGSAPVDAAAVQAECARRGVASTCGFRAVQACGCDAGQCRPQSPAPVDR